MQHVANSSLSFESDNLAKYIEEIRGRKPMAHLQHLPTLDRLIGGVVPGIVTVIGAAPGTGKTTLLKVISDDLASQGFISIFYSVELPAFRIAQKGITRLGFGAFDLSEVGQVADDDFSFGDACRIYAEEIAPNSCILDGELSMEDLCRRIGDCIHERNATPVLFVDYLQLLASTAFPDCSDERVAITSCVRALGNIAKTYDVPVFVLSSVQRAKYDEPSIGLDVFAGSQGIDYGIDNGLYLYVEGKDKEERRLNAERNARPVVIRALKARYGTLGSARLWFDAPHANFIDSIFMDKN